MTRSPTEPDGPTTDREFEDELGSLLRAAHDNGVDVEGGWAYRTSKPDYPDWGIEVYTVVKPEST